MQRFQPDLSPLSGSLTKCTRSNIVQLQYKYIIYSIKYEHLHENVFNCAYVKLRNIFYHNLVVNYIV